MNINSNIQPQNLIPEVPQLDETSRRAGAFSSKLAKSALAFAILSGGACQDNQTSGDIVQAEAVEAPETTLDPNMELIEELSETLEQQQQEIDNMRGELDYVGSLTGMSPSEIERHLSFPTIERISQPINPELAKKQDAATMYVLSYDTAFQHDDTTPLVFSCTAVKTEDNKLTSSAHCFDQAVFADYGYDLMSDGTGKGGGEMPDEFQSYVSSIGYYVADRPNMTIGEAKKEASPIVGFALDHASGDSAMIEVIPSESFSEVEPLVPLLTSTPEKGDQVRVAGYPNGSAEPVVAEGIVLGEVFSDEVMGYYYRSNLLIVGITPTSEEDYTCSFGASGSGLMDENGNSFGALATVTRSGNPIDSLDVTPTPDHLKKLEDTLEIRLADQPYILCGFSPILPTEMKPFVVDPKYSLTAPNGEVVYK